MSMKSSLSLNLPWISTIRLCLGLCFVLALLSGSRGWAQFIEQPRVSPYSAPGSIFPTSGNGRVNSLFSDPTAYTVGDFITIIVNLNTSASLSKQLNTAKTANVADSLTSLIIPNNVSNYGNQWAANQSFKGGGTQADTEGLTTTLQAKIVEILPNDTFRIEAHRLMQIGKERSDMTVAGVVRRRDLGSDNSISSTLVGDLQIKQGSVGDISRSERKGWLTTAYEFLSPF